MNGRRMRECPIEHSHVDASPGRLVTPPQTILFNTGTRKIALLLICLLFLSGGCGLPSGLMEAAKQGDIKRAKRLLWFGADVNARNRHGATPLMVAVYFCHKEMAEFLIDRGADVNAATADGHTVLMNAVLSWHCGYTPEHFSVKHEVEQIIANMANVNVEMDLNIDMWSESRSRRMEIVELLIEKGSEVNAKDKKRYTALMICAAHPVPDLLEVLLANEADPNTSNERGQTPLIIASEKGHVENARLLITSGADPGAKNKQGQSALSLAVKHNHHKIVGPLLKAGAEIDFDVEYYIKHPPEGFMDTLAFSKIVGLLEAAGADINIDDIPRPIPFEDRTFEKWGDLYKSSR